MLQWEAWLAIITMSVLLLAQVVPQRKVFVVRRQNEPLKIWKT